MELGAGPVHSIAVVLKGIASELNSGRNRRPTPTCLRAPDMTPAGPSIVERLPSANRRAGQQAKSQVSVQLDGYSAAMSAAGIR